MTLLSIVQKAAVRCDVAKPITAFSSLNSMVQQMVAFALDSCQDLGERWDWTNLKVPATIIGDGATTMWPLPDDWSRLDPSDRSQVSPFVSLSRSLSPFSGPINDEILNQYKALSASQVYPVWRIVGGALEIWPALALNETVTFTYISKNTILRGDAMSRGDDWTSDQDTALVPEDTVMKGTIWRWKASKGLDYAEEMRQYELSFDRRAGQEGQGRVVGTSLPSYEPAPDFWPGTIDYIPS